MQTCQCIDSSSITHQVNFDILWDRSLIIKRPRSQYIRSFEVNHLSPHSKGAHILQGAIWKNYSWKKIRTRCNSKAFQSRCSPFTKVCQYSSSYSLLLNRSDSPRSKSIWNIDISAKFKYTKTKYTLSQWVNSVPPYVRKLHFMYEAICTSGKCRWNIYRTSSKCRWSIYRTSRKRRGTLRIVHKVERSSPTVFMLTNFHFCT